MSTKKLELKGKHLATLKLLCQSLSGDGFPAPDMALAQEMAVVISGMQQGEITKETALSIIMRELDISIVDYYHRMKPPFPFDYNDLENIKKESIQKLRNTIENLPYRYSLRIELPSFPIFGAWTFPINNEICVTQGACNFDPPPATHAEALVHALRGSSAKETTFLEFKTSGYATESIDSPALAEAISRAKCCAAIFYISDKFIQKITSEKSRALLNCINTTQEQNIDLPTSLNKFYGALTPHPAHLTKITHELGKSLLGGLLQIPAETKEEMIIAIQNSMMDVSQFFGKNEHPDFSAISASLEWFHDSVHAENQTFAYLAACIGLEALIGNEKRQISEMSKRLTDRYGFLMGRSRQERETLALRYEKVLEVRGKLVHAKVARLSGEDHQYLSIAQDMLLKALRKELHRIFRDPPL